MTALDCCGGAWMPVEDLGSAESFDFLLGRCARCGQYWMNLWSSMAPKGANVPVTRDDAERLLALPAWSERKRALADWFNDR